MQRALALCLTLAAGCAVAGSADDDGFETATGKADVGSVPAAGTWTKKLVSDSSMLWNGGPTNWGAGTSVGVRADGQPVIAYYDAAYRCANGGWGTYSPDALMLANHDATTGWKRRIAACGPEWGYWPRLRVDDQDRTHVLIGGGWATRTQRAFYMRLNPAGTRELGRSVDSGYMSSGALAMTLDDSGAPVILSNGKLVADDGTKTPIFTGSTVQSFMELDADGAQHIVASTMIPEPNNTSTSVSRLRYARRDTDGTVTIELPRTAAVATPLGLVIDSGGQPHVLSWNKGATPGGGELWHSTRTATGWVETLITSDAWKGDAAMAIDASDQLLVVAPGRLYRLPAGATSWTSTVVTQLSSASYPSMAIAPDGTLHVAYYVVGPTMSNRSARAPVYHASFVPTPP